MNKQDIQKKWKRVIVAAHDVEDARRNGNLFEFDYAMEEFYDKSFIFSNAVKDLGEDEIYELDLDVWEFRGTDFFPVVEEVSLCLPPEHMEGFKKKYDTYFRKTLDDLYSKTSEEEILKYEDGRYRGYKSVFANFFDGPYKFSRYQER